jgi:phosphatidylserine/phosphatidylglycerophosphate/cardiolipin synthase-like enzyme
MKNDFIIGTQFSDKVIPYIDAAKNSLKIVVYDWRWYQDDPGNLVQLFNQAIVRAVKRGVKVEAIVNNEKILSFLKQNGVAAKKISVPGLVHTKFMLLDLKIVILGSHNYTHNAFVVNQELSVVLSECEDIYKLNDYFITLWSL